MGHCGAQGWHEGVALTGLGAGGSGGAGVVPLCPGDRGGMVA
jgi:hypothetical protein